MVCSAAFTLKSSIAEMTTDVCGPEATFETEKINPGLYKSCTAEHCCELWAMKRMSGAKFPCICHENDCVSLYIEHG